MYGRIVATKLIVIIEISSCDEDDNLMIMLTILVVFGL